MSHAEILDIGALSRALARDRDHLRLELLACERERDLYKAYYDAQVNAGHYQIRERNQRVRAARAAIEEKP
ncbi:MAG: hypothetical protein ACRDGM_10790 [bacterium]